MEGPLKINIVEGLPSLNYFKLMKMPAKDPGWLCLFNSTSPSTHLEPFLLLHLWLAGQPPQQFDHSHCIASIPHDHLLQRGLDSSPQLMHCLLELCETKVEKAGLMVKEEVPLLRQNKQAHQRLRLRIRPSTGDGLLWRGGTAAQAWHCCMARFEVL